MADQVPSRRRFIGFALAAAATPLLFAAAPRAGAAGLVPLPADNAQAKALKYTANAAASKDPAHKPGSACANCQFFTAATGACQIFPGFKVEPTAWCSAWAKKA